MKMTTVSVTVFRAAGLTVSGGKTETILVRTPHEAPQQEPLVVEAADQKYQQTNQCTYLGGIVDGNANSNPKIERRIRFAWAYFKRKDRQLYDWRTALLQLKVSMLNCEVLATLFSGCIRWTLGQEH